MSKNKKQEQVATFRDKALALLRSGKHEAALATFATLERLEPEQPDWPRRAAECHRALDDSAGQIAALGRAAERYQTQGAVAKAIAMSRMILNLDPNHAQAQKQLLELQGGPSAFDVQSPPLVKAPEPPRMRLAAPPPPEKPEPAPTAKADAPARPRLEQILRQRRAATRDRRPPTEARPEPPEAEREPVAAPVVEPTAAAEPGLIAEPAAVDELELVALRSSEPVPELEPVAELEAVAAPASEPVAALRDELGPEPEIVADELEISSMPAPKPSVSPALPSELPAGSPTPVPPSDEAVTLRPAPFANGKATDPAA